MAGLRIKLIESIVHVRINIVNEPFKPAWPKYDDKQTDCTGNWNRAYTKNHKHNKDYCTFDSGPARNCIHFDSAIQFYFCATKISSYRVALQGDACLETSRWEKHVRCIEAQFTV